MLQQSSKSAVSGLERRAAKVIHYKLSYVVQGAEYGTDGAIVLLHDLLGGAFTWETILPQLASLKRAVYTIDLLGYGASDHPWPADTSTWGHADSLQFLLDELSLTNIVLVGHGLGGGVAQILATRLSVARVAALVLIDTICYSHAFAPDWPLSEMEKSQDPELPFQIPVADAQNDLRATLPAAVENKAAFANEIDKYLEPWNSHTGKEVLYQHVRNLVPYYTKAVSSDLKVLKIPSLIIWGEKDQQNPVRLARRLHRDIPGSQLVMIPNAGHLVLFDNPAQVSQTLVDFISQL
jgi:pimeloyl-ACP methyl ester carboxylesterase